MSIPIGTPLHEDKRRKGHSTTRLVVAVLITYTSSHLLVLMYSGNDTHFVLRRQRRRVSENFGPDPGFLSCLHRYHCSHRRRTYLRRNGTPLTRTLCLLSHGVSWPWSTDSALTWSFFSLSKHHQLVLSSTWTFYSESLKYIPIVC